MKTADQQIAELKAKGWLHEMKIYFSLLGDHAHCRIFTGKLDGTVGLSGQLVMTIAEFEAWRNGSMKLLFTPEGQK
jgi:hypothetical protein